jgi:hypothetical protein
VTLYPGEAVTLTAEWRMYAGGPLVAVTGVTITITPAAGGPAILGPTAIGVTTPAVGINAYAWEAPGTDSTLIVEWTGTDSDGDTVTAVELVEVATPAQLYTDLTTVKSALGKLTVDDRDDLIVAAIRAACRQIDARCGRRFYLDAAPTARVFHTSGRLTAGGTLLLVDDIGDASTLTIESGTPAAWVAATGAVSDVWPTNAIAQGQPATALYATTSWSSYAQVRITTRWGYPVTPDQISVASALLSARLYRRKDSPQGVLGSSEWGMVRVTRVDADVEALIAPFVLPGFA